MESPLIKIRKTLAFEMWFERLSDKRAKTKILARIKLAEAGHFGDRRFIANGVWEMRIDTGSGYRIYYARGKSMGCIFLLGGDKQTQPRDIAKAKAMWQAVKENKP